MEELNLAISLYFVDVRPLEEIRPLMEQILGCSLRMRETDDRIDPKTFDGQFFGITISLSFVREWTEGCVYWLRGGTLDYLYLPEGKQLLLDSYTSRLLGFHSISTVMTPAIFGEIDQECFPEDYAALFTRSGLNV
jgi:hypothetical protein